MTTHRKPGLTFRNLLEAHIIQCGICEQWTWDGPLCSRCTPLLHAILSESDPPNHQQTERK